jgi:hypothetical protein
MTTDEVFDHGAHLWLMQRNHNASSLLRLCHQTPDWWTVGGRPNAYSIEWLQQGSASDWYFKNTPSLPTDATFSFWFKMPELTVGTIAGLFDASISGAASAFSFDIHHSTTSGKNEFRPAVNGSIYSGTAIEINADQWYFGYISLLSGTYTFAINGGVGGSPTITVTAGATNIAGYRFGKTSTGTFVPAGTFVDEIAFFFGGGGTFVTSRDYLYNNGAPIGYYDQYPHLEGSYEVERGVGAIHANSIPATHYLSTPPPPFNWSGSSGVVAVSTDALRSVGYSGLVQMGKLAHNFFGGFGGIGGDYAIGNNRDVSLLAGGLLPYPTPMTFDTTSSTNPFVGSHRFPQQSPLMTKSGTVGSNGDSTAYPANGGTGSLQDAVDTRSSKRFVGTFVKKP